MARTPSNPVEIGSKAPDFNLVDTVSGKMFNRDAFQSPVATVIMFICNHCPFVLHINDELVKLAKDYMPYGVNFVAISSNDVEKYPEDSPQLMKERAQTIGYPFPYLYDQTQEVAHAYDAACTPDFYIYNPDFKLTYHGQLDDARPGNDKLVNGKDIRVALDKMLAGESVPQDQKPSMGCNIKWKE